MSIETILKLAVAAAVLMAIGVARLGFLIGRRVVGRMRSGEWPETGTYRERVGAWRERTSSTLSGVGSAGAALGRALAASLRRTAIIVARLGRSSGEYAAVATQALRRFDRRAGKAFAVGIVRIDDALAARIQGTAPRTQRISAAAARAGSVARRHLLQPLWALAAMIMASGARWSANLWGGKFLPGLERLGAAARDPGSGEIPSDLGPLGPPLLR